MLINISFFIIIYKNILKLKLLLTKKSKKHYSLYKILTIFFIIANIYNK